MFGFKTIEKLSIVAIPSLIIIIIANIASVFSGDKTLAEVAVQSSDAAMPLGMAISIVISTYTVGAGGEIDFSKVMLANNLYSGALLLNAMFPKLNKWVITVVSGVVGTVLALLGINTAGGFQAFLGIIAILIPPAASVMILDYYFFKSEENCFFDSDKIEESASIRIIPLVAWAVGSIFGFIIQYTPAKFTSIVALDTIIAAGIVYAVIMLITKKKK